MVNKKNRVMTRLPQWYCMALILLKKKARFVQSCYEYQ
jgi:hypothetical protein